MDVIEELKFLGKFTKNNFGGGGGGQVENSKKKNWGVSERGGVGLGGSGWT